MRVDNNKNLKKTSRLNADFCVMPVTIHVYIGENAYHVAIMDADPNPQTRILDPFLKDKYPISSNSISPDKKAIDLILSHKDDPEIDLKGVYIQYTNKTAPDAEALIYSLDINHGIRCEVQP